MKMVPVTLVLGIQYEYISICIVLGIHTQNYWIIKVWGIDTPNFFCGFVRVREFQLFYKSHLFGTLFFTAPQSPPIMDL